MSGVLILPSGEASRFDMDAGASPESGRYSGIQNMDVDVRQSRDRHKLGRGGSMGH